MSEPFTGQLMCVGFPYAPRGWSNCDGQLLPIAQHTALFSLFGTMYGGDGRTTFGLPDLRGRVPIHVGTGPGLSPRKMGQKAGRETVVLATTQIPAHTHPLGTSAILRADNDPPDGNTNPLNQRLAASNIYGAATRGTSVNMANTIMSGSTENAGGTQAHDNMQPFQVLRWIVSMNGIYPSRS